MIPLYSLKNNNIVMVLFVIIFFLLFINYMFKQCREIKNQDGESFTNKNHKSINYTKLRETVAYDNDIDESKAWDDLNLNQCIKKCNDDDKCIGFTRTLSNDSKKVKCFPKYKIDKCNSLRKSNKDQRLDIINYNTYLKQNYLNNNKNILNTCIGDKNVTLNRNILVASHNNPDLVLSYDDTVKMQKFDLKDSNYHKKSKFKIVPGLIGGSTVSFILVDNLNENYYLVDNYHEDLDKRHLELMSFDPKSPDVSYKLKNQSSFQLEDGMSDSSLFSICNEYTSNHYDKFKYYWYLNENSGFIKLKPKHFFESKNKNKNKENKKREHATFHIMNHMTHTTIKNDSIDSFNDTTNQSSRLNNRRKKALGYQEAIKSHSNYKSKLVNNTEDFKSTFKVDETQFIDNIMLVDENDNKIRIPIYAGQLSSKELENIIKKHNYNVEQNIKNKFGILNLEDLDYASRLNKQQKFNKNKIYKIIITNPKLFSCKIYNYDFSNPNDNVLLSRDDKVKNLFNYENIINHKFDSVKLNTLYTIKELEAFIEYHDLDIDTFNRSKDEIWCDVINQLKLKYKVNTDFNCKFDENNKLIEDEENITKMTNITNEINDKIYFNLKSIKILNHNPRLNFYKKVNEMEGSEKLQNRVNEQKLYEMRKKFNKEYNDSSDFDKYFNDKKNEYNLYKEQELQSQENLLKLENSIISKINNLTHQSDIYKLNKTSDDYFMKAHQ